MDYRTDETKLKLPILHFIIPQIVTLSKYGHDSLNIRNSR